MGQLTYNSIRIYKHDRAVFLLKEMESLKSFIFNSPFYFTKQFRFVSRFTPLIFSLTENDSCIEAQFNTYEEENIVRENLERLYEMTFPGYDFWFIEGSENTRTDKIGRFKSLSIGENSYASTTREDWRDCLYGYNKIEIFNLDHVPGSLSHITFRKEGNRLISMDYQGLYTSYSEKNFTDGQRYKLIPEEHTISFEEKYNPEINGIGPVTIGKEYYSDAFLKEFIRSELAGSGAAEIKFYFNNRLTRIVTADKPFSVCAFDGWDNCADGEFTAYINRKTTESVLLDK